MAGIYCGLPPGGWIRVLEVREGSGELDHRELICNFKYVCVDDCMDKFTAVSYAWEDSSPVTSLRFSHGPTLSLSQTLTDLFDALRQSHQSFTVWVDALCINQSDPHEKAHQVSLMGKIYSSAENVLLWLGASTPLSHTAFRFMWSRHGLTWPDDWEADLDEDLEGLESVFSLLSRPWFQRVWVIQEITLNRNVTVACGVDRVGFDSFRDCVFATWALPATSDCPELRGLWSVTRIIHIRQDFLERGPVRYEKLLETACHARATDRRDKVFAFWGIGNHERPLPKPDYTLSVDSVYLQTAEALLLQGTSLDALALAGIWMRNPASNLPTWASDFRCRSWSEPLVMCDSASWDAGGSLQVSPRKATPNQLKLQVRPLDIVDVTCPEFDSTSVADQQAAIRAVLSLRHRLSGEVTETDWKQSLRSSLIFGLDVDDEPAGPEYEEYFQDWLSWLQSSTSEDDLVYIHQNKYQMAIGPRINGWKAFLTRQGIFGIGPLDVETGDVLCVVPGCRIPLILRPKQPFPPLSLTLKDADREKDLECTLVSWCFAEGIMYGEALASKSSLSNILLA